jgi:hypothetical protein
MGFNGDFMGFNRDFMVMFDGKMTMTGGVFFGRMTYLEAPGICSPCNW